METAEDALHYYWQCLYDLVSGMRFEVKLALKSADLQKALAIHRDPQRQFLRSLRKCEELLARREGEFDSPSDEKTLKRIIEVLKLLIDCHSEVQAKIRRAYKRNEGKLGTP